MSAQKFTYRFLSIFVVWLTAGLSWCTTGWSQVREIPPALKPWSDWATWEDVDRFAPRTFDNAQQRMSIWPSVLTLDADAKQATWKISVQVFSATWFSLPGSKDHWPTNVQSNGQAVAVIGQQGRPAIRLQPGRYEVSGNFDWNQMPQQLQLPPSVGLLSLTVDGEAVSFPAWSNDGQVWLKRQSSEEAQSNSLSLQIFRVIEDGIPMWLRTDVELTVSGKAREEELGCVLPAGWKLATVDSQIPVAVDERGNIKAQVRAGIWTVSVHAFRTSDVREIQFADDAQPMIDFELVAFKSNPAFRLAELTGLPSLDVSQTSFPEKWRGLPVYQWQTDSNIVIEEKLRGMGTERPAGLKIERELWLDEDGGALTYRDKISGTRQQLWRLDSAAEHALGAVRADGKGQLITINPENDSVGVEIRNRNLDLEGIGRISSPEKVHATGWQTDADSLEMKIYLPPGWRMFALFGADEVMGDWLTAWSLLDLFLLLIFATAVFRVWGFWAGLVAMLAFGLSYHEPSSPRYSWFFLLIPVALLRVVPAGFLKKFIVAWKYFATAILLLILLPFLSQQVQNAIYPQLEESGVNFQRNYTGILAGIFFKARYPSSDYALDLSSYRSDDVQEAPLQGSKFKSLNLSIDPRARIQTGPAQPEWSGNQVRCQWSGPVSADQKITPMMISCNQNRIITAVRVLTLIVVLGVLLGFRRRQLGRVTTPPSNAIATMIFIGYFLFPTGIFAQDFPDTVMLQSLRNKILQQDLEPSSAAEIPVANLSLDGNQITMNLEVHAATEVAVPLPGKLPVWAPLAVLVNAKPAELVCRSKDYLWVVVPAGVHQVSVRSLLPDVADWEWTFLLPPRKVLIEAAGWNVTGLRASGVPEKQVFFSRQQQVVDGTVAYDRKDFNSIMLVERQIETGLAWKVNTVVTRLSNIGKATTMMIPLLPGEKVLDENLVVKDGEVEVSLGAHDRSISWTSELPIGQDIRLSALVSDQWVEQWQLLISPVWNVTHAGLAPIFEAEQENLIPVWKPWPGEEATLSFHEPVAVAGETTTIQRVRHETNLGSRQRVMNMKVDLESSLGGEFPISLGNDIEISEVTVDGVSIPARRNGEVLIVPVKPGKQSVEIQWRRDQALRFQTISDDIILPVETANITQVVNLPSSQWVLWAWGPARGPAVRFWIVLIFAVGVALVIGSVRHSPLSRLEWVLLVIGLTQVNLIAAMFVVLWLFMLAWRKRLNTNSISRWSFNLRQIGIVLATIISLIILVVAVGAGLLGNPKMFVLGNGSYSNYLNWFQPLGSETLPRTSVFSISVWYYRLLMLLWALWLSFSLLRWLADGWQGFTHGDIWGRRPSFLNEVDVQVVADNLPEQK